MGEPAKSCYLKSNDETLKTVYLPDQKAVFLGRCPETNIIDSKCSRQQVQLYADYGQYKVFVKQTGLRHCGFNGFKTSRGVKFVANHNDHLEILYGKHAYQIEFNPAPPQTSTAEKRARESNACNKDEENPSKVAKIETESQQQNETQKVKKPRKGKNSEGILRFLNTSKMNSNRSEDNSETAEVEEGEWEKKDDGQLYIYTSQGVKASSKIAAYDMDGTLIVPRSGLVFPKDYDDWQLIYSVVPTKLKELHNNGYKIVIFTNQAAIGAGKNKIDPFKNKIRNIVQMIGVPMQIFIASGYNFYRKPTIGMWQQLEQMNDSVPIDKDKSFYVGDSAGRAKNWAPGRKKDHSFADRLLALNLGLQFYTPEEHFLGHKQAPFNMPAFDPKSIANDTLCLEGNIISSGQEVVIMVGSPASGKSHFAKNYLKDYGYVNRDTLGSWQKCVTALERFLSEKNSAVVDNTNPDCASRQRYIEVANKHGVPIRCFVMTTSDDHAEHNNKFRELTDPSHTKINRAILASYRKSYQEPKLEEGFAEIVRINFVPKFENEEHRNLYEMYLVEK